MSPDHYESTLPGAATDDIPNTAPAVWQNAYEAVRRRWDAHEKLFVIETRFMDPNLCSFYGAPPRHDWDRWRHHMATSQLDFAIQLFEEKLTDIEYFWMRFERAKKVAAENSLQDFDSYRHELIHSNGPFAHPLRCEHAYTQSIEGQMRARLNGRNPDDKRSPEAVGIAAQRDLGKLITGGR